MLKKVLIGTALVGTAAIGLAGSPANAATPTQEFLARVASKFRCKSAGAGSGFGG